MPLSPWNGHDVSIALTRQPPGAQSWNRCSLHNAGDTDVSASDHLPENAHYRDDGCEIAPRCLECPLPACRYDLPPKRAGALLREAQLRELLASGLTADQAAIKMGVSRRTVFRLKRYAASASVLPLLTR